MVFAKAREAGLPSHRLCSDKEDVYLVWDCMCVHLCNGFSTPVTPAGLDRKVFDELEKVFIEENKLSLSFPTREVRAVGRIDCSAFLRACRWVGACCNCLSCRAVTHFPVRVCALACLSAHDPSVWHRWGFHARCLVSCLLAVMSIQRRT